MDIMEGRFFLDNYFNFYENSYDQNINDSVIDEKEDNYSEPAITSTTAATLTKKSPQMGLSRNSIFLQERNGRMSLAYEKLTGIPKPVAEQFAPTTTILDLSHNNIQDLSFLSGFKLLNSLVLDKNASLDEKTLPYLPNLKLLWLNNCEIENLPQWIYRIQNCCPSIKYLSLMGNPGATSTLNGATVAEHNDYRHFVISVLHNLYYLDDTHITTAQKLHARSNRCLYSMAGGAFNMFNNMQKNYKSYNGQKRARRRLRAIKRKANNLSGTSTSSSSDS